MIGHPFTPTRPPADLSGAPLQSWLRRRIATLENQQAQRIALTVEAKKGMNASISRAQLEITNLQAQLTMGVAR